MTDVEVLYIMGAGRSGTTILATLLGASEDVVAPGELNQLPEHVRGEKPCGCGTQFRSCPYWAPVMTTLSNAGSETFREAAARYEQHDSIWKYFLSRDFSKDSDYQAPTLSALKGIAGAGQCIVDSSKYIGRALALSRLDGVELKILYLVRDPRGVVESFGKRVQTSRAGPSATIYYVAVNFAAELVARTLLRGKVLKVRYEDLVGRPHETLTVIEAFIGRNLDAAKEAVRRDRDLAVGHLVGGNRIRSEETVKLRNIVTWPGRLSRLAQFAVWLATMPLSLVNRYRP